VATIVSSAERKTRLGASLYSDRVLSNDILTLSTRVHAPVIANANEKWSRVVVRLVPLFCVHHLCWKVAVFGGIGERDKHSSFRWSRSSTVDVHGC
jgi:hypothetical protein